MFCAVVASSGCASEVIPADPEGSDAEVLRHPGAIITWVAEMGFTANGPIVSITGEGSLRIWRENNSRVRDAGVLPVTSDESVQLSVAQANLLFDRVADAAFARLPHAGAPGGDAECGVSMYVRLCATCSASRFGYNGVTQILPEMDGILAAVRSLIPPADPPYVNPWNYCR